MAEYSTLRQARRARFAAERLTSGGNPLGPRTYCCICGKILGDAESVERGIGSECWRQVLTEIETRATPSKADSKNCATAPN